MVLLPSTCTRCALKSQFTFQRASTGVSFPEQSWNPKMRPLISFIRSSYQIFTYFEFKNKWWITFMILNTEYDFICFKRILFWKCLYHWNTTSGILALACFSWKRNAAKATSRLDQVYVTKKGDNGRISIPYGSFAAPKSYW